MNSRILVVSLSPAVDRNYHINNLIPGKLHRCDNPVISAGGKGVNCARVLSQLGAKVFLTGFFAGSSGDFILDDLKFHNIDVLPVMLSGETRSSINILDASNNLETEILELGPFADNLKLEKIKQIVKRKINSSSKKTFVILSGGIPAGLGADTYANLISFIHCLGGKCMLDTSSEGLIHGITESPYFIKPNIREFAAITGYNIPDGPITPDITRKIKEFAKKIDVPIVAVTLSERGAIVCSENSNYYAKPLDITPVNTIGSGDSFTAGFTHGISKDYGIKESLRLGIACASSNALSSKVGTIDLRDIVPFLKEIIIEEF